MAVASCTARLVKNLPAWLTSLLPFEKKKLAPRRFYLLYLRAIVREIIDFPVPARPFSQKMHCSFYPSFPSAQSYIRYRRSIRVSGRQAGSYWRLKELNSPCIANGRRLRGSSRPIVCQLCSASLIKGLPIWYVFPSWALAPSPI
jgi:hypothetical protein